MVNANTITDVSTGSKTFTVAGDHTTLFPNGSLCYVMGSTLNDSSYTVVSSTFSADTVVTVEESIQDSIPGGSLYDCPASVNCIFEMASSAGITIQSCVLQKFDGICLKGNISTPSSGLVIRDQGGVSSSGPNLVASGHFVGIELKNSSSLVGETLVVHECDFGIEVADHSVMKISNGAVASNNTTRGLLVRLGSAMEVITAGSDDTLQSLVCSKNDGDGIHLLHGTLAAFFVQAIGNTDTGILAEFNSVLEARFAKSWHNDVGMHSLDGSTIFCPDSSGSQNTSQGYIADKSNISASGSVAQNNDVGVLATRGSFIRFDDGIVDSNTTTQFSPAINTEGNDNSYITDVG